MDTSAIANKLRNYIEEGDFRDICLLLNDICDPDVIEEIEFKFLGKYSRSDLIGYLEKDSSDPVNFAIAHRQESIATYLVEKGFSIDKVYQWPEQQCDDWCFGEHGVDQCPAAYTASDHAGTKNLYRLKNHIDEIKQGKRTRGQKLASIQTGDHLPKPPTKDKQKMDRNFPTQDSNKRRLSDEIRELLKSDKDYKTYVVKNTGYTLMHEYVRKPKIYLYIFANAGVPVNIQNVDGDTALHMAVREGIVDSVEALLQCSADLTIRNKMGMTPLDELDKSNESLTGLLNAFKSGQVDAVSRGDSRTIEKCKRLWCNVDAVVNKPGIVHAVCNGKASALDRLVKRTWCSFYSKVKEGKSLLELAESLAQTKKGQIQNCYRILKEFQTTSRLIHAVLCDDVEVARDIIQNKKGWNVNLRLRDHIGKTLLSHAVESNNLELVKLLVENGAKFENMRVRENEYSDITVPLFQKAIHPDINPDIAKYLNSMMSDKSEHSEKDHFGDTTILRAIDQGCSAKFIKWLINARDGFCLTDRNKEGKTPKELAIEKERDDVVKVIDKFLMQKLLQGGIAVTRLPTHFWKEKDIKSIKDEITGKRIDEMIDDIPSSKERKLLADRLNFHDIQNHATRLFEAASTGKTGILRESYDTEYQDKNGYTVLIKAIVFQQLDVCKHLCTTRPSLKLVPDCCNRYPLHYAYVLPPDVAQKFKSELLGKDPETIEKKVDEDGRSAADFEKLKETTEVRKMLYDARTLDLYGKRGPPLGPWPEGAERRPPDENQPMEFLEIFKQ